jgi:hypothetical protein
MHLSPLSPFNRAASDTACKYNCPEHCSFRARGIHTVNQRLINLPGHERTELAHSGPAGALSKCGNLSIFDPGESDELYEFERP